MDVEGAEGEVVAAAGNLLTTKRPVFFVELHGWTVFGELWSQFETAGYRIERLAGGPADVAAARRDAGETGTTWIVARPA